MKRADVEDGARRSVWSAESAELREAYKCICLLEQETEVLKHALAYVSQSIIAGRFHPLVRELPGDGIPVAVSYR